MCILLFITASAEEVRQGGLLSSDPTSKSFCAIGVCSLGETPRLTAKTPQIVSDTMRNILLEYKVSGNISPTRPKLLREVNQQSGFPVKIRTLYKLLNDNRKKLQAITQLPIIIAHPLNKEIEPWGGAYKDDTGRLIKFEWNDPSSNVLLFKLCRENFTIIQAQWALRLRYHFSPLDEAPPKDKFGQYIRHSFLWFAIKYASREMINQIYPQWIHLFQGSESVELSNTLELDIALTFRPWESRENLEDYRLHIISAAK